MDTKLLTTFTQRLNERFPHLVISAKYNKNYLYHVPDASAELGFRSVCGDIIMIEVARKSDKRPDGHFQQWHNIGLLPPGTGDEWMSAESTVASLIEGI